MIAYKGAAEEEEPAEESRKVRGQEDQQKLVKQKPRVGSVKERAISSVKEGP